MRRREPADPSVAAECRVDRECGHIHDTTTRYDVARKLLTFLLVCPACDTEKVLETLDYEPRFEPRHATVHRLPLMRLAQPARRAA
jgi:hypothetical protein